MITFIRDNKFALWRIDDLEGKGYYGTCESYEGGQLMVQAKTRSDFFDQIERLCATRERKLSRDDAGPIVGATAFASVFVAYAVPALRTPGRLAGTVLVGALGATLATSTIKGKQVRSSALTLGV
jgi:hypothetical protein